MGCLGKTPMVLKEESALTERKVTTILTTWETAIQGCYVHIYAGLSGYLLGVGRILQSSRNSEEERPVTGLPTNHRIILHLPSQEKAGRSGG